MTATAGGRLAVPGRRTRFVLWLVVAGLLVAGAGAGYLRQGPTDVTVDDAVARFRAAPTTGAGTPATSPAATSGPVAEDGPAAPAPAASPSGEASSAPTGSQRPAAAPSAAPPTPSAGPAPRAAAPEGVYTYRTKGYEETNALGGARHDYPQETAVTVRRSSCGGFVQRWQPLEERWDESELCEEPVGYAVRRFTTYHEFFQQGQTQEFHCPAGSHVTRHGAAPGATWTWQCTSPSGVIDTTVTVVGPETMTVDGRPHEVTHMHYRSVMSGSNRGTQDQHRWLHRETGLAFKITTTIDTEADSPFGAVRYEEHYTITLLSLTPRR